MANITTRGLAPTLTVVDGKPTTTSNDIAKHFGKDHAKVMRDIRALLEQLPKGYESNFGLIQIDVDLGQSRTRKDPAYRITRDGFTLLAMGFTGKRALTFKLAYIEAFNRLEAKQASSLPSLVNRRFLVMFDHTGKEQTQPIDPAAYVLTAKQIVAAAKQGEFGADINRELAQLAQRDPQLAEFEELVSALSPTDRKLWLAYTNGFCWGRKVPRLAA